MQTILRKTLMAAQDRTGATAIEYGLIAAGIGVVIIGVVFTIGTDLLAAFQAIADKLSST